MSHSKEQIVESIDDLIAELQYVRDGLDDDKEVDDLYDDLESQSGVVRTILKAMQEVIG